MLLLALLLVLLNGFFVATEFAIVKVRATRIRELIQQGNASARVAQELIQRLDAYLSACQLGITLASLGLGWIGEPAFAHLIEPLFGGLGSWAEPIAHAVSLTVAFLIITFLHIVAGEVAPKSIAIRYAEPTALFVARPMRWFYRVFYPAIWLLNAVANGLLRVLGLSAASDAERGHSEEELRLVLAESLGRGPSAERRRALMEQALSFPDRKVREIMVPRADVAYLDLLEPIEKNLETARREGYTRYPVCRDHLDEVVGIVHVRDLFAHPESLTDSSALERLCWKALFIPESATADALLRLFQQARTHMAIVVDEYGGTSGLVTLEDVLEELTGEILDEFDVETPPIEAAPDGTVRVAGHVAAADLARHLGVDLASEDAVTVAGLVLQELGRVARVGDVVRVGGVALTVLETRGRRITRLAARPAQTAGG
jgi:CBS domain containing-hemolysin-like protein